MQIRLWGVRGSIPFPGPRTVRYGGNTTCIEVRTREGHLIILDAGTGIFPLAHTLLDEQPISARIFITHSHWDHIQGLPFFLPLFHAGNQIELYATAGEGAGEGPERVMRSQFQFSYFPVGEMGLKSPIQYRTVVAGEDIVVGSARVRPVAMNHPGGSVGYLITECDCSVFFTGDHEPYATATGVGAYSAEQEPHDHALASLIRGVDLVIADSMYTQEEYPARAGWGHGTFDSCMRLALTANARHLLCTHHESNRSDDELEQVLKVAVDRHAGVLNGLTVQLAREGDSFVLDSSGLDHQEVLNKVRA